MLDTAIPVSPATNEVMRGLSWWRGFFRRREAGPQGLAQEKAQGIDWG
jgi:hypothetical protein